MAVAVVGGIAWALIELLPATPIGGALGLPADRVTLVEVTVGIEINRTGAAPELLGLDSIRLPHCARGRILEDGASIELYGGVYDRATSTILVVRYAGPPSFSGGGDDTSVVFLRDGESAAVLAAFNRSTELYRVVNSFPVSFAPLLAKEEDSARFVGDYIVGDTAGDLDPATHTPGNFSVREVHTVEVLPGAAVFVRDPGLCL